jgi:cell division protein FtsW
MANRKRPDSKLLVIIILLVLLGLVILASASSAYSFKKYGNTYYFLLHQIEFGLLPGLLLGFLAYRTSLEKIRKFSPKLMLLTLMAMVAVFLPFIGSQGADASRWIGIGSFSFQPAELLKLAFILYFASWLTSRTEKEKKMAGEGKPDFSRTFGAFLFLILVIGILLYLQPNVSTLAVIMAIALVMYFANNTPFSHTIFVFILVVIGILVLIQIAPYRLARWTVFINPDYDTTGTGYQLQQSLFAVGSGGWAGKGFGLGVQRFGILPQTISDSIFAVFAEETGFIGACLLVFLFLAFAGAGFKTAKKAQDSFQRLTAIGISSWIIIQAFVNIGAMTGILPLTGIPLPFIGYGGSALALELVGMGILLNISKNS